MRVGGPRSLSADVRESTGSLRRRLVYDDRNRHWWALHFRFEAAKQ